NETRLYESMDEQSKDNTLKSFFRNQSPNPTRQDHKDLMDPEQARIGGKGP
ncbi:hypothetical protein HAX54_015516, partial [Datura stramonium]|nr:hypothetical protein [Datura stramonium]